MTTTANISPSSAENLKANDIQKKSIYELFEEVAEDKVFQELYNEAALIQKIKDNPNEVTADIRSEMKQRLLRFPSGYQDFTEADIRNAQKLSDATILEKMNLLLLGTKTGQEKLRHKVLSLFSRETFNEDIPNGNENLRNMNVWIAKQNEKNIEKYLKYPIQLRKKLRSECFGDKINCFIPRGSVDFLQKLGINEKSLTAEERTTCSHVWNSDGQLQQYHIRQYLKIVDKSSKSRSEKLEVKKEIIREFLPTVTPKLLVELGVIKEDQAKEEVKNGLESVFGAGYFEAGTDDERRERQRFLEATYKKGWYIEVAIDEYLHNDSFVEHLFERSTQRDTVLVEGMYDAIKDMQMELGLAQLDLDGLKITPDVTGGWHKSFVENIKALKDKEGKTQVKNANNLQQGAYIRVVQEVNGEKKYGYLRIVDVDIEFSASSDILDREGNLVKHRGIRFEDWTSGSGMVELGNQRGPFEMEYAKLATLLTGPAEIEVITEGEMIQRRASNYTGENQIKTEYSEGDTFDSIEKLSEALGWKPEKGHLYSTKDMEGGMDFYIEIVDINEASGTIKVSDGVGNFEVGFAKFHEVAKELKLKDIGKYENDSDLTSIFQSLEGFKDLFVENGVIMQRIKDDHGKEKKIPIHHFMNEDGEGMYFTNISSSGADVSFGVIKDKKKDWSELKGKVNLRAFSGSTYKLSMAGIINQIRDFGYKPYINPKDKPEVDHEEHLPHSHGTFWGKIMNGTSVSDMKRAFDLYIHAWEHKMEKNSKFQAARFADKYLTKLMPEGMRYSLRSEASGSQNEAMEGVLKMLEEMNGKTARLHVRHHILLNNDAKFEEVLAGLLYISKKTGQLYPEELSDLKNSNIWFHKLAVTQGYKTKASREWLREKCVEKSDKFASGADALTEMDLVERQLKYYEGMGFRIPPNIAPKFPGALVEGKKGNQEKGEMEVNQRSNIKQMNKYALSKLNVGEAWKAMGCIDRLHTKNGSPTELNVIPFTLLMSNAPEYMGSEFRKALHSEGTGPRASHAFKFGNEMSLVKTYRNVVGIAAAEVARRTNSSEILDELRHIEHERHHIGNESHSKDTEDDQKNWINSIFKFWMKYGADLQPILQMTDPFISAEAEFGGDTDAAQLCTAYKNRYIMTSAMQNGQVEKIYDNANVTEGNMGPDHTPFAFTNLVNGAISAINYQDGQMSNRKDSAYGKIFKPGVLGALEKLRNLTPNDIPPGMSLRNVQESIFKEYYAALMYYFRQKGTNPPEKMFGGVVGTMEYREQNYIHDLRVRGFRIQASDFRNDSETIPAGVEVGTNGEPNGFMIDGRDMVRCKEMFNEFINTSAHVTEKTGSRVNNTFDWGQYGG